MINTNKAIKRYSCIKYNGVINYSTQSFSALEALSNLNGHHFAKTRILSVQKIPTINIKPHISFL